jgi:predicted nucleic acid-binding protein
MHYGPEKLAEDLRIAVVVSDTSPDLPCSNPAAGGRTLGLPRIGTLGVLLRAKALGHTPAIKPLLTELVETASFSSSSRPRPTDRRGSG